MTDEDDFRAVYNAWLWRHRLPHGAPARSAFAAAHPALCGRDVAAFLRRYQEFRLRRGVHDQSRQNPHHGGWAMAAQRAARSAR